MASPTKGKLWVVTRERLCLSSRAGRRLEVEWQTGKLQKQVNSDDELCRQVKGKRGPGGVISEKVALSPWR